jgi:hypothetical protein
VIVNYKVLRRLRVLMCLQACALSKAALEAGSFSQSRGRLVELPASNHRLMHALCCSSAHRVREYAGIRQNNVQYSSMPLLQLGAHLGKKGATCRPHRELHPHLLGYLPGCLHM